MAGKIGEIFSDLAYKIFIYIGIKHDKEILTKTSISDNLNMPWSSVSYHITKFYAVGLISYKDRIINLTDKGLKLFKYLWKDVLNNSKYRAHNIQIICEIVCKNVNHLNKVSQPFTNKRYEGLKLDLLGCKVVIYSLNKLVCIIPAIYADKEEDLVTAIAEFTPHLINALEQEFDIKVISHTLSSYKSIHVAVLNSILAKSSIISTGRMYTGKWVSVDRSHKIWELETTNPDSAIADMEKIVKYEDLARENEQLKKELSQKLSYKDKISDNNESKLP